MEAFFALCAPIAAALFVYNFFQHDLKHAKSLRKLKVGAVESLIKRHRIAAFVHLGVYLVAVTSLILSMSAFGVVVGVMWTLVFMGHMLALSRFSRQMTATMEMSSLINNKLEALQSERGTADIHDDGELREQNRQ
ncbi:MAG: hypothetical protein AAFR81_02195 [Chloroflexota bacterium]